MPAISTVRRLTREDPLHDLLALSRQFFEEYEAHHGEFFKIDQLCDEDVTGYFSRFLDADDRAAFVTVVDGEVVGYITVYVRSQPGYWQVKQVGEISGLMVRKDHRRAGIGSRLMREALAFLAAQGVKHVTVYTAASNRAALEFYARQGMTPLYVTMLGTVGESGAYA